MIEVFRPLILAFDQKILLPLLKAECDVMGGDILLCQGFSIASSDNHALLTNPRFIKILPLEN